jgi:hypothetical protein
MKYFYSSFYVTLAGLVLAYFIGGIKALWIVSVLSILEVSLSFDNAIVNAKVLKTMDDIWKHRFITWGMLIAVGVMRLLFPLLIVSIATGSSPISALTLAISEPESFKHALESVHTSVMGYGGSFLFLVALKFFIDNDKEIHWLEKIENKLTVLGKIEAVQVAITLALIFITSNFIKDLHGIQEAHSFIIASIWGIVTFILVDGLEAFIGVDEGEVTSAVVKSGLSSFIYLEVLDASFSFDGVIGAFALSNNLFVITIGLAIGAMFVRSLTLLLVDKGTVDEFVYLEHGAFYAIFGLATIMFTNTVYEISETITGLIGAAFIVASLISSILYNKKHS